MLKKEIELNRDFESPQEEFFLNFLTTAQKIEESAKNYLKPHKLNPTQFNALLIIRDYQNEGLLQKDLSRRLLINAASTGTLIDRLVNMKLIKRLAVTGDRRAYHLKLTANGTELLEVILPPYYQLLKEAFTFSESSHLTCINTFDSIRQRLKDQ